VCESSPSVKVNISKAVHFIDRVIKGCLLIVIEYHRAGYRMVPVSMFQGLSVFQNQIRQKRCKIAMVVLNVNRRLCNLLNDVISSDLEIPVTGVFQGGYRGGSPTAVQA